MFAARDGQSPNRPGRVLIVDDVESNRHLLERVLGSVGYDVITVSDGEEALAAVNRDPPDVVITDVRMPRRDGFALCEAIKGNPSTRLIPVVLMTGASELADRLKAIEAGADEFLTKPIDSTELRARIGSLMRVKRFTDDLDSAEHVLRSLALMIEARDGGTEEHCRRLATYAQALGRKLGLSEEDLVALGRGGYFHDIGKVGIPDAILLKPGPLTAAERQQMMRHPVIGDALCGDLHALHHVRPIVRHHHERLDGSGYPDGLRGDAVPLLAQIVGIVDVYDAMTSDRPYRRALHTGAALEQLKDEANRGWRSPILVGMFCDLISADEHRLQK